MCFVLFSSSQSGVKSPQQYQGFSSDGDKCMVNAIKDTLSCREMSISSSSFPAEPHLAHGGLTHPLVQGMGLTDLRVSDWFRNGQVTHFKAVRFKEILVGCCWNTHPPFSVRAFLFIRLWLCMCTNAWTVAVLLPAWGWSNPQRKMEPRKGQEKGLQPLDPWIMPGLKQVLPWDHQPHKLMN